MRARAETSQLDGGEERRGVCGQRGGNNLYTRNMIQFQNTDGSRLSHCFERRNLSQPPSCFRNGKRGLERDAASCPSSCRPARTSTVRWPRPLFGRCVLLPSLSSRAPLLQPSACLAMPSVCGAQAVLRHRHTEHALRKPPACTRAREPFAYSCACTQIGERNPRAAR